MNVITLQPRNEVGQYEKISFQAIKEWFAKAKAVVIKAYKVARIVTVISTVLLAFWGVWLTHQVYQFRCQVNGMTVGYFSRRVECANALQNWIDSQPTSQTAIDNHVAQELEFNPDLK